MANKAARHKATKRSVSAPRSLWAAMDRFVNSQQPPVPLSRRIQELMARDLREAGLLNGNGKEAHP